MADTSVWIDHLHANDAKLKKLLDHHRVAMHPFVQGELFCGNIRNRDEIMMLITRLPRVHVATHEEVLFFIQQHNLTGKGIGYIDAHLLAATALSPSALLWTRDKSLLMAAKALNLSL